jgi:hypothetical protein
LKSLEIDTRWREISGCLPASYHLPERVLVNSLPDRCSEPTDYTLNVQRCGTRLRSLPQPPVIGRVLGCRDDVLAGKLIVPSAVVVVPVAVPERAAHIICLLIVLQRQMSDVVPNVVTRPPTLSGCGCNGDVIVVFGPNHRPVRTAVRLSVIREPVQEGRIWAHFDALRIERRSAGPPPSPVVGGPDSHDIFDIDIWRPAGQPTRCSSDRRARHETAHGMRNDVYGPSVP